MTGEINFILNTGEANERDRHLFFQMPFAKGLGYLKGYELTLRTKTGK